MTKVDLRLWDDIREDRKREKRLKKRKNIKKLKIKRKNKNILKNKNSYIFIYTYLRKNKWINWEVTYQN